jgi:hypothetical protein
MEIDHQQERHPPTSLTILIIELKSQAFSENSLLWNRMNRKKTSVIINKFVLWTMKAFKLTMNIW